MTLEPIGVVTVAIGIIGLRRPVTFLIKSLIIMTILGGAGAVLLTGSGTIQPAHLLLGFVSVAVLSRKRTALMVLSKLWFPSAGFWLSCFGIYAVGTSLLYPRIFAGITSINAIGLTDYGPSILLVPLGPTSGNITQSIYVAAGIVCFLFISGLSSYKDGAICIVNAILVYSILNIVFGLLDIVTFWTQTSFILSPIRNANYAFHLEEADGNLKRIAGSFTETSAFSYATIGALAFNLVLWLQGYRPRVTGTISLISTILLLLSTSTTALVSIPALGFIIYVFATIKTRSQGLISNAPLFVIFAPLISSCLICIVLLNGTARNLVVDYLNSVIFEKATSDSGQARGSWNANAFQNFLDTYFFGGGLGSIRASSFALALLSNVGAIGSCLFLAFLASIFLVRSPPHLRDEIGVVRTAARLACAGLLISSCISGTLVDLGLMFYIFAGLSSGGLITGSYFVSLGGSSYLTCFSFSEESEFAKSDATADICNRHQTG